MMITKWHLLHLPVWIAGQSHPWANVQEVVFSWPDPQIQGLVLDRGRLAVSYVEIDESVRVTPMGVTVPSITQITRKSRIWWKREERLLSMWRGRPIYFQGALLGVLKDLLIDESRMVLVGGIVSRGLLDDLWNGTQIIPLSEIWEDAEGRMNL